VPRLRVVDAGFVVNDFHCDVTMVSKRLGKDKL
jgi:hypothetical protein